MSDVEMGNAQDDAFFPAAKSSVKLIKNSRGVNWEIRCVKDEGRLLQGLMEDAIKIHKKLEEELK